MQAPLTRIIAALIAATLVLAACGGDSTDDGNGDGVASLAEAEDTSSADEAAASAEGAEGAASEGTEPLAPEDAELAFAAYDDCMADAGFDFGATIAGDATDGEGVAFVLGGLNIRTRDYARFGQMILCDGQLHTALVCRA